MKKFLFIVVFLFVTSFVYAQSNYWNNQNYCPYQQHFNDNCKNMKFQNNQNCFYKNKCLNQFDCRKRICGNKWNRKCF